MMPQAQVRCANLADDDTAVGLSVLNIQRTCVHDGPGIRSTVFFRGCNMRCRWCHNPEAQRFVRRDDRASRCSVAEVVRAVRQDREYYRHTHGGVTLSGGEPLLQDQASLLQLLAALKEEGIEVAIETAGDVPWRAFQASLPFADLFLFDLKAVGDDALHLQLTGRPRRRVAENIARLVGAGAKVRFRMCVVAGLNDSPANLEAVAALLHSLRCPRIELLRYYDMHEPKAAHFHLAQEPLHITAEESAAALERTAQTLTSLGIAVEYTGAPAMRPTPAFTQRVHELQKAIRDSGYAVCLESARLKTAFHKTHGFHGPLAVQRANLLRHLLNEKTVAVYPHELLVGNFTAKRVGGNVWPEYFGTAMAVNLWRIDRQKPVAFKCSLADKLAFYFGILPFWIRHGLVAHAFPSLRQLASFMARTIEQRVAFNNNMAAIAHFIVNTERLLKLGTSGIAEEVKAHQAERRGDDDGFYDGVLIALAAVDAFAERYAKLLGQLRRREANPQRRAELEAMQEVCGRVPKHPARCFHEALQSILFMHVALCTESFENAISLGRLDRVLHPYYAADVAAGRLDYDAAKELLACFILKLDEIVLLNDGDTAFQLGKLFESLSPVETVTIGGVDPAARIPPTTSPT